MIEQSVNALPSGTLLHDYKIMSVLGEGGFGITYKAEDVNLSKLVAIKEYLPAELAVRRGEREVLPRSSRSQDDFNWGRKEFLQEAKTLAQFDHPNIVPVLRFFEANGTAYIVMAFQEGDSLFEVIRRGPARKEDIESLLPPILDGLAEVHGRGYLHRDIKPENIFVRRDGTPVLLDFGAARQALGSKTRTLTSIVSRGYAPFEQYTREGRQGPWSDIYALGAVLYAAINGEPPPDATDRMERDDMVAAVDAGRGRFDEGFLRAIDWALAVRAQDRPQTLAEWRAALYGAPVPTPSQPAALARGETLRSGDSAPTPRKPARGRSATIVVGSVFAMLLSAGGAYWLYSAQDVGTRPAVQEARQLPAAPEKQPVSPTEREVTLDADALAAAERAAQERAEQERRNKERAEAEAKEREAIARAEAQAQERAAERASAEERAKEPATEEAPPPQGGEVRPARKPLAPPPPAEPTAPAQSAAIPDSGAALKTLLSGAIVYVMTQKSHPIRNDVWRFQPDGSLEGAYSEANNNPQFPDYTGSDRGSWAVEAGRLCVQWTSWDEGQRRCYRITGAERNYQASDGGGLLEGPFQLNK